MSLLIKRKATYSDAVRVSSSGRAHVDVAALLRRGSVKKTIESLRSKVRQTATKSKRFESERLLLQSASWGVVFLALGRLSTFYGCWFDWGKYLRSLLHQLVPAKDEPYLGTAVAALLFGWGCAYLINFAFATAEKLPFLKLEPLKLQIVERYDNGLLRLFHEAMYMDRPVSVTLSNRKVYVGYVAAPPNESPYDSYFVLLLLLSGYRDEKTMSMVETINYADKIVIGDETEDPLLFFITLSMDNVVSANFFDLDIYKQHFTNRLISSSEG